MSISVDDAGTWKDAAPYCNDGGVWKLPLEVWANDAGTWKLAWQPASGPTPTFNPVPGYSYSAANSETVSFDVTADMAVSWTWTTGSGVVVNRVQGESATNITFSITAGLNDKTRVINLTATSGGVAYTWTITLTAYGGGGTGGP